LVALAARDDAVEATVAPRNDELEPPEGEAEDDEHEEGGER
jgi:hypothetical protein